jgi:hypothetical protein
MKPNYVYGSMFHTNIVKLERQYFCDDDCKLGGCSGHKLELEINSTSGVGCIKKDGIELIWLGCNQAQAIYEMFENLINEND